MERMPQSLATPRVTVPSPGRRPRRRGYTLVELFLTIGVLMMVLGLVINLDSRLRAESLERKARGQLRRLAADVDRYAADHGGRLPDVPPPVDPAATGHPTEPAFAAAAARNRDAVRRCLGLPAAPADDPLTDPWGTPIVFVPHQSRLIPGLAFGDRPFFVSAGPDRRFLFASRADNLYSYDDAAADPSPTTAP